MMNCRGPLKANVESLIEILILAQREGVELKSICISKKAFDEIQESVGNKMPQINGEWCLYIHPSSYTIINIEAEH